MDARRDQLQVLEHFNKALRIDKARPQIAQLSELGLVELTRKRQGKNVYELFGQTCPTCSGLGHIVHLPGESHRTEVEIAEPIIPIQAIETRTPSYQPVIPPAYSPPATLRETPLADTWEARNEGVDYAPGDDDDALDLMNHPSYQERGGLNNNRRRRRRRIGDNLMREEAPPRTPVRITPAPVLNNTSYTPIPRGLQSNSVGEPPEIISPLPEPFSSGVVEERLRIGKPERLKPTRQEIEPPEIVAIEMTSEEQDVYALMGVSPLLKLEREVKNPKSVIISVNAPGESAPTERLEKPVREVTESEEAEIQEQPRYFAKVEQAEEQEPTPVISSASENEAEPVESTSDTVSDEEQEPDSGTTVVRRRRRRSSATS